jgi:hypothetical protein
MDYFSFKTSPETGLATLAEDAQTLQDSNALYFLPDGIVTPGAESPFCPFC